MCSDLQCHQDSIKWRSLRFPTHSSHKVLCLHPVTARRLGILFSHPLSGDNRAAVSFTTSIRQGGIPTTQWWHSHSLPSLLSGRQWEEQKHDVPFFPSHDGERTNRESLKYPHHSPAVSQPCPCQGCLITYCTKYSGFNKNHALHQGPGTCQPQKRTNRW